MSREPLIYLQQWKQESIELKLWVLKVQLQISMWTAETDLFPLNSAQTEETPVMDYQLTTASSPRNDRWQRIPRW